MSYISRALALEYAGNFAEAAKDNETAIELFPTSIFAHTNYFTMLMDLHQFEHAKKLLDMIKQGEDRYYKYSMALIHASQGEYDSFNRIMQETSGMRNWDSLLLRGYLLLGMKEEFFQPFVRIHDLSLNLNNSQYERLITNPIYEAVHSDPRFQEILAKHKKLYEENLAKYGDIDI